TVEIVFDNSDQSFSINEKEISIKRTVRRNGQSLYKINNQTKTRQEVLSLLAQAGIDPNGFNIILQGQIQNLVRMHTDERRKIIEEVSGISIYEIRKEKSLKELEKTEERLKEVGAILRERTTYLNNLEKERQQALRFKKLEKDVKKFKASILQSDLNKNKKSTEKINLEIEKNNKEIEKLKKTISEIQLSIRNFESKINSINSTIQESTGFEQEKLNSEIANLRADLAGLNVKFENSENKISEIQKLKLELQQSISENESSLNEIQKSKKTSAKSEIKQKEINRKKIELEKLEEQRKRFYTIKSELKSIRQRIEDKKNIFKNYTNESEFLVKQIKSISQDVFYKDSTDQKLNQIKISLKEKKDFLESFRKKEIQLEKKSSADEHEVEEQKKLTGTISKMDICPVCKSKITEFHIHEINSVSLPRINLLQREIENSDKELSEIYTKKEILAEDIEQFESEISKRNLDIIKISNIEEKKEQIKELQKNTQQVQAEISELEKISKNLENKFHEFSNIEQKYETTRIEVEEVSLRTEENIDSEISFKKRELERAKISLKQYFRTEKDFKEDLAEIKKTLSDKKSNLETKRKQEEELSKKFQKLILERDTFQKKIHESQLQISSEQNRIHNFEQDVNNFKIEKARVGATVESLETELLEFSGIEIIQASKEVLVQRLVKTQEIISKIGSVNLRSLEVYDEVKKEYEIVQNKVEIITKEKQGILKIVSAIDIKKKKTFLNTLNSLNEIFSRNFTQLSIKGQVSLELENKKDPFDGGVNILVKIGHGKYFDVTSLSGGEQTLVALSLIFAIQELNPYCFYILDEIDAALDKRNSERLAGLLKKYMQKGQYIIITHNDEIITKATNLYGVSMHDGISKVISLKV
ncbi:MAG: chromosome segregation protein SMC, partial [Nanoarchaeota archaeon]|nr:chromosome segregation protein SMC [Nanoarchaeota archaeon]